MMRNGCTGPRWAALLLTGMIFVGAGAPAFGAGWWNEEWRCMRKVTVQEPKPSRPGEEAGFIEFTTGGFLQPTGADIRVLVGGKLTPHQVLSVGPGDRVSLFFKHVPGRTIYQIYYGNPKCQALDFKWTPQRGLILETRPYRGGGVNNWGQMQATLRRAGPPYGRGIVPRVWHGHNPFGPSMKIVSVYTGWLNIVSKGPYEIITSSASASFLFVDDKLVVQWPGWHRAVADGRHRRRMTLQPGVHKFAYYHAQGDAPPIMVAAWRNGRMKKAQIIPAHVFMPPLAAKSVEYRLRGKDFAADFSWGNVGEALFQGHYGVTVAFNDTSYPRTSSQTRREWEFGDGVKSKEFRPSHVFLATGTHTVTLKVFRVGKPYVCRQKVLVDRDWGRQHRLQLDPLAAVAAKVDAYPFESMSAPALFGAVLLYQKMGRTKEMLQVGNVLLKKLADLPERDLVEAAVVLGGAWRDTARKPKTALGIFRKAEKTLRNHVFRARLAVLAGDVLLYHLGKTASAKVEYERVAKDYPKATEYVRLSLMRLGDVARRLGQLPEARHYYQKALGKRQKKPPGRETMDMALRALETEDLLRRGELEAVEKSLHLWQWQDPEAKVRGHWSALAIRLAIKRKDWAEAAKEAETLVRVNPESQYVPEILLLLARTRMKQGRGDEAREALERIVGEYPDSPLVKEAQGLLTTIGSGKGKP